MLASLFFLQHTPTTKISPLSLHDALPISEPRWQLLRPRRQRAGPSSTAIPTPEPARRSQRRGPPSPIPRRFFAATTKRSEEHTSELQSRFDLVCRLLLEKKK